MRDDGTLAIITPPMQRVNRFGTARPQTRQTWRITAWWRQIRAVRSRAKSIATGG